MAVSVPDNTILAIRLRRCFDFLSSSIIPFFFVFFFFFNFLGDHKFAVLNKYGIGLAPFGCFLNETVETV